MDSGASSWFATKNQATALAGERRSGHGSKRDEREEQGWSRRREGESGDQIDDVDVGSWAAREMGIALVMLACVASGPAPITTLSSGKTKIGEVAEKGRRKRRHRDEAREKDYT